MKITFQPTKDNIFRLTLLCACLLFSVVSLIVFAITATISQALICVLSILCLCLPDLAQRFLKLKIATPLYAFILLYAICPMLGHAYKFYYLIPWWDTLLHAFGGVVFAIFGAYLPRIFDKKHEPSLLMCAAFGFFFSVAIAGLWEFVEYGCDVFLGTDMQQDTIVGAIHSYLIGGEAGVIGHIPNIESVLVNGEALAGYIDLGVIDTMTDMIFETLGALLYTVVLFIDKGKRCTLRPAELPETEGTEHAV